MLLYMAVTTDKYELPIAVEDSVSKLAARLGIRSNTINVSMFRSSNKKGKLGMKFVKLEVD